MTKGLFLLVQPIGGKIGRLEYGQLGKKKKLFPGRYLGVTLQVFGEAATMHACYRR